MAKLSLFLVELSLRTILAGHLKGLPFCNKVQTVRTEKETGKCKIEKAQDSHVKKRSQHGLVGWNKPTESRLTPSLLSRD
jgi:hypothetical protein